MEQEWISLNEFMRRNHLGYETAIRLINSGKLEYEKTGRNKYKIKVSKNANIDETMEKLIRENEELKTYIKTLQGMVNQIKF